MSELVIAGVIGSAVLVITATEKRFERKGLHMESDMIRMGIQSVLTIGGFGALVFFFLKIVKGLMFLV